MPIDLERQLAELGTRWNDTVSHVGIGEILERSDRSADANAHVDVKQSDQPAVIDTADRRPRWLLTVAAALIVVLLGSMAVIGSIDDDSPAPVDQPTPSTDVSATTAPSATSTTTTSTTTTSTTTTSTTTTSTTTTVVVPPASGSFAPTGSLQTDCFRCPALLLGDGRVFVAGGAVIQIYNPATETFSIAGQVDPVSAAHGALLPDGQVILAGGNGELAIVDPKTGSARTLRTQNEQQQIPAPMDYTVQIPVALEDGRVLVFSQAGVNEVDLATGTLSPRRAMATPLADTMLAMPLDDGNVLVIGRTLDDTGSVAAMYDSDTGVFVPVDAPSSTMNTASAIRLLDGRVLLTGDSRNAEIFDPRTGTFSSTGSMSAPGGGQAEPLALLPDGRVLVVRSTYDITAVATTEIFDPATGTFTAGPATTRPRFGATAVTLRDGRVLLLGSYRGNSEGIPGDGPSSAEIFFLAQPAD